MQLNTTLPPIKPHTEAKHDILRHYMGAWFPILGRTFPQFQYIDGFAGPGGYEGGEMGSPIIALSSVADHDFAETFKDNGKRIDFLFVEKEEEFAKNFESKVRTTTWPSNFNIDIRHSEFEPAMKKLLDQVDAGKQSMPPTLLFIDPFGSAGFSMELLARLAKYRIMDVLINFNWTDLNHWILSDSRKHTALDKLYGNARWRPALSLFGEECKAFMIQEYRDALNEIGWRGTNFEMINQQNQTQYYLLFGTRGQKGMEVMKKAMRRVSPDGLFQYRDRTDPAQHRFMEMGMKVEYADELASHLFTKYQGAEVSKDVLQDDEVAWHPRWIESDLTAALKLLESSTPPQITSVRYPNGKTRRRGSYPAGCLITFSNSKQNELL